MRAGASIAEQWFARTTESYPGLAAQFLALEEDPFRNPVGHTLHESLATLASEFLGDMDADKIESALGGILRIRAVQDFTPSEAVGFVFLLKPIMRELGEPNNHILLDDRIDRLALMAFDKYMQCREQLGEIRVNEAKRAIRWIAGV